MQKFDNIIPGLEIKIYGSGDDALKSLEGKGQLDAWKGFQSRQGPYNGINNDLPSDGQVKLMLGHGEHNMSVLPEQAAAWQYIIEHQHNIQQSMLHALLQEYPAWQDAYGYNEDDAALYMPDVHNVEQFKSLMGLGIVHLLRVSKDGIAYTGYEFGCTWDDEHGLGILTYKDQIIEVGQADSAFNAYLALKHQQG